MVCFWVHNLLLLLIQKCCKKCRTTICLCQWLVKKPFYLFLFELKYMKRTLPKKCCNVLIINVLFALNFRVYIHFSCNVAVCCAEFLALYNTTFHTATSSFHIPYATLQSTLYFRAYIRHTMLLFSTCYKIH
jgi:hypothetical protein